MFDGGAAEGESSAAPGEKTSEQAPEVSLDRFLTKALRLYGHGHSCSSLIRVQCPSLPRGDQHGSDEPFGPPDRRGSSHRHDDNPSEEREGGAASEWSAVPHRAKPQGSTAAAVLMFSYRCHGYVTPIQ